jgi:hypothetical protein
MARLEAADRLICGDLHGRTEIVEALAATDYQLIFLGDFLDSFDRTAREQVAVAHRVIELTREGRARFVLGNHEWSYLDRNQRCSGWNNLTQALMETERADLLSKSDSVIVIDNEYDDVVVTHAGIHQGFWNALGLSIEHLDWRFQEGIRVGRDSWVFHVGYSRGGGSRAYPFGGPFWCDWNDEFMPIHGIRQIVGHTVYLALPKNFDQDFLGQHRISDNGDVCIDTLDRAPQVLLMTKEGKFSPYDLTIKD